ncbi:MAG: exodeoxyribonuclease VII small subunit [Candidatus Brocadia sp. AMX2]|uniref:Exodeoxyribonuclease 7 small subunit n=1 Tax=Candidatus Brocadia sinica JPN1 TaxID=1197129 RepID=A0ABQ0JU32_9BACT|nr:MULTISPECIES: exodeoxyribonuclease VII small subunit [Brocadia]KXK31362.1 MAG: exodeoxyribonuclease VII small chain [Candidatus Brocadia sinica]MBC6933239.1 exodeoxyribonuclease VII small subunit [Candidatus Brocadia sp.]MBL1168926.1 exodeoxyribonuclease VII small subunit [Candidatus Brocadia sp. AMX1]NOG41879.1 exodeoxyribonuclease VII small subunit [Planctomycetota bacterium]KAA0241779.1 MAG: exodeoxyribonuclease VII small subunit [Candidatus Brocadia sp. AMX2]
MAKIKFEEALKGLEDIVERLEKGDLPLDETLSGYEDGIKLYKQCVVLLEGAEKKIQILVKDENGAFRTRDFGTETTQNNNAK